MFKYYRSLFLTGILTLSFFGVARFCKKATGGFTELSICHPLESGIEDLPSSLSSLYDQKFYYLGKGAQSFVFLSEDKKTVIKFLRFDHLLPKWPIRMLSFIHHPYFEKRIKRSQREIKELVSSFDYAANDLKDFTYLSHFQKKGMKRPLLIHDKIGVYHEIKNAPFVVQPYAPSIESILNDLNSEDLKTIIDQAIDLTLLRTSKGYIDTDPNIVTNFGLNNGTLVQFDIGRFSYKPESFSQSEKLHEIRHVLNFLLPSILAKHAHLQEYVDAKIEDIKNSR